MPRRRFDIVKQRPVYLDLPRIRLPLPGIVSILHRVSGALLFLAGIPLLLAGVAGEPRLARGVRGAEGGASRIRSRSSC